MSSLLERVHRVLSEEPSDEILAGVSLELAEQIRELEDLMEPLKGRIRERARRLLKENPGSVKMPGVSEDGVPLGVVTVTFPAREVKLAKGADIDKLREVLGVLFEDFFDRVIKYTPKKDLPERVRIASGDRKTEMEVVLSAVEYIDSTPRVGFSTGKKEE